MAKKGSQGSFLHAQGSGRATALSQIHCHMNKIGFLLSKKEGEMFISNVCHTVSDIYLWFFKELRKFFNLRFYRDNKKIS